MAKHLAMFHQLGLVTVWEANFIIVMSLVHRAASFETVSYITDILKAKMPIWEKEMYEESCSFGKRKKECFGQPMIKSLGSFRDLKFKLGKLIFDCILIFLL